MRDQVVTASTGCLLLALLLVAPLGVAGLATSKCTSPTAANGVVSVGNRIRAPFGSPAMAWNATLASRSQLHANKCKWEHSSTDSRQWDGENIFYTWGISYPFNGLYDACAYADVIWATQVSSYNFDKPAVSRDGGDTLHFTQLVWRWTTQVGCGMAQCPGLNGAPAPADFVVCQYHTPGNWLDADGGYSHYLSNVRRSACMESSGDDWCSACDGARCTQCYPRATFSGASTDPIVLDATTGRCFSKCPSSVTGCSSGLCTANNTCSNKVQPPSLGSGGAPTPDPSNVGRSCVTAPTASSGVLTLTNTLRKRHGAAALSWNTTMASRAQVHAGKCVFAKSAQSSRNNDYELIFRTVAVTYPRAGRDACATAAQDWYNEVASYKFASPSTSLDAGVVTDFSQVVWAGTKQMGCGYASCSGFSFVVCQYDPPGNAGGPTGYSSNVKRAACQTATKDDWCSACSGATCTACTARSLYAGGGLKDAITLDAATKKCVSKCQPGNSNSANCAVCGYSGACVRCNTGWLVNSAGHCLVRDCAKLYGSGCTACTGISCTKCTAGFSLNPARLGCTKALVRRAARSLRRQI